jgi:hypothetical protein
VYAIPPRTAVPSRMTTAANIAEVSLRDDLDFLSIDLAFRPYRRDLAEPRVNETVHYINDARARPYANQSASSENTPVGHIVSDLGAGADQVAAECLQWLGYSPPSSHCDALKAKLAVLTA